MTTDDGRTRIDKWLWAGAPDPVARRALVRAGAHGAAMRVSLI
jgi:hypothetical protein